jgi:hypothetical protein
MRAMLEGAVARLDLLGGGDLLQALDDELGRDRLQVEALAAGDDGREHLLHLGGGEDELHVRRRLLEGLEQRVERRRREHVHLVDDVDLELALGRRVADGVAQVAHLLDAVVRGAVDLDHVEVEPSAMDWAWGR